MNNQRFVEDVFASIRKGVPLNFRFDVQKELYEIGEKHQSLCGSEFKEAFLKEASPFIETYSRMNVSQELATIRIILYIFLGGAILGAFIAYLASV